MRLAFRRSTTIMPPSRPSWLPIYIYIHISLSLSIYIYIYVYMSIHIYIYIRGRNIDRYIDI